MAKLPCLVHCSPHNRVGSFLSECHFLWVNNYHEYNYQTHGSWQLICEWIWLLRATQKFVGSADLLAKSLPEEVFTFLLLKSSTWSTIRETRGDTTKIALVMEVPTLPSWKPITKGMEQRLFSKSCWQAHKHVQSIVHCLNGLELWIGVVLSWDAYVAFQERTAQLLQN